MEGAKQRRTFTAISFKTANARPESAYSVSFVHYKNDKLVKEGTLDFRPMTNASRRTAKLETFEIIFEEIRQLVTTPSVPVIVWDDKTVEIFNTLILKTGSGIVMKRPPRYFKVRDYAIRRIGKVAKDWNWQRISNRFKLNPISLVEPDAEHIAALMLQIENSVDFPSVIAKAFCRFCQSVLEDNVVTLNEAVELRSFVILVSDKYPEFKKLEEVLDDVLEDGKVTDEESLRLVRILTGMSKYYGKFIRE